MEVIDAFFELQRLYLYTSYRDHKSSDVRGLFVHEQCVKHVSMDFVHVCSIPEMKFGVARQGVVPTQWQFVFPLSGSFLCGAPVHHFVSSSIGCSPHQLLEQFHNFGVVRRISQSVGHSCSLAFGGTQCNLLLWLQFPHHRTSVVLNCATVDLWPLHSCPRSCLQNQRQQTLPT